MIRLGPRRSVALFAVMLSAMPFVVAGRASAAPIVAPPVPPVVAWGAFAGFECVNITEPGTFHSTFNGIFTEVPFVGGGLFSYSLVSAGGVSQGSWVMANLSPGEQASIFGTHQQTPTRTIVDGVLQVDFVDRLTVAGSEEGATGVSGKIQAFGTRTFAAPQQGCFLTFFTSGSLLAAALKQQT